MRGQDGTAEAAWKPALRALGRGFVDFAFPPHALDGGPGGQSTGLAADAWARVRFLEAPWCEGCGTPFPHPMGEGALCAG